MGKDNMKKPGRTEGPGFDNTDAGMRTALYVRVSTDRQSTANQKPDLDRIVRARDLNVVGVYEESASAAKHRPAFERMLQAAHRGEVDVLVIWALDRFGRSMAGNLNTVLELDRIGVTVISCREPWLDTGGPVRQLLIAIFSWVAEQERSRIGERTQAGLDKARRKGVRLGRPKAHINVSYARQLREQGMSIREAARKLGVGSSTLHRLLQDQVDGGTVASVPKRSSVLRVDKHRESRSPIAVP